MGWLLEGRGGCAWKSWDLHAFNAWSCRHHMKHVLTLPWALSCYLYSVTNKSETLKSCTSVICSHSTSQHVISSQRRGTQHGHYHPACTKRKLRTTWTMVHGVEQHLSVSLQLTAKGTSTMSTISTVSISSSSAVFVHLSTCQVYSDGSHNG